MGRPCDDARGRVGGVCGISKERLDKAASHCPDVTECTFECRGRLSFQSDRERHGQKRSGVLVAIRGVQNCMPFWRYDCNSLRRCHNVPIWIRVRIGRRGRALGRWMVAGWHLLAFDGFRGRSRL